MIVNPEPENLGSDPDLVSLWSRLVADARARRMIGRRDNRVQRKAEPIHTKREDGRPTIVTACTNTQSNYFEGAGPRGKAASSLWIPWRALPDGADRQGLILESAVPGKTAYYERSKEARVRLPNGLLRLVSGGGLFRCTTPRRSCVGGVPRIVVQTQAQAGRSNDGQKPPMRTLLNPWVLELDTMTEIAQEERRGLARIAAEGEADFHPEFAPGDWLRIRVHAALEKAWRAEPARTSVMLGLLLGGIASTGRHPWEITRAFAALDVHHGKFDVRPGKDGTMEVQWGDGDAADRDPLVAHAGAVLGAAMRFGRTGAGEPEMGMSQWQGPAEDEEFELESAMESCLEVNPQIVSGLAARIGAITAMERELLENDLIDGEENQQATLAHWCMNHVQPRSRITVRLPEPPAWIGDRGWCPDATLDPRGGDRPDLLRDRAAVWWLRLLDPGNRFDTIKRLEAHGAKWKAQFFVWLFRGRDAKMPQWADPPECTPAQTGGWGRLGRDLILGGGTRQAPPSGPDQGDWPTVLEQ